MITFPNCKINLGLNILRKRDDGFHDLETIFLPLAFNDVLEVIRADDESETGCRLVTYGLPVGEDVNSNICYKAYELIKQDYPQLPHIQIHLLKNVFTGAGLGGGSADGAFTLSTLNHIFHLNISKEKLIQYALQLGSDCPFFLLNKPCFAKSRGEIMEEVAVDLSAYTIVIVNPGIHINTGWAFKQIQPHQPDISLKQLIQQPVNNWKNLITNDFEKPVFQQYPEIEQVKNMLYENGAIYASMSGSGSTLFGIFMKTNMPAFSKFKKWKILETKVMN